MNYEEIIENLEVDKVKDLLIQLGATNIIDKETHFILPTICHNESADEASMKLYFYKDTKLFVCYTECNTMSIFKFLKHYYETRQVDYDWYQDILQVILNCSLQRDKNSFQSIYKAKREDYYLKKDRKELPKYSKGILDVFVKRYPVEWIRDNITPRAMDKFNIRYSISQNKIIIPHYDINDNLIGIRGRALNEWEVENLGKYMPVQIEQKWYSHPLSLNLYGLNVNKENIQKTGVCYLFEAEKSVMQMESFDIINCSAAVCGSQLNKFQIDLLLRTCHPREIVLCFDKEELKGEDKYFDKLWNICYKYRNYCNFSFVYDREGLLDLKDSPSDKGEEVFKKLLEKRIKVK